MSITSGTLAPKRAHARRALTRAQPHKEALAQLRLLVARGPKGHSAFIADFREALTQTLPREAWHVAGGEGSLVAIHIPCVEVLREVTWDVRGLTSALRLHLFMERPRKERARAVLEVVGNHPRLDAVVSRRLRYQLAADLRARIAELFDQPTRGQIVGAFELAAPSVIGVADDTQSRTAAIKPELKLAASRVRKLGEVLQGWSPTLRKTLLAEEGRYSKMAEGHSDSYLALARTLPAPPDAPHRFHVVHRFPT